MTRNIIGAALVIGGAFIVWLAGVLADGNQAELAKGALGLGLFLFCLGICTLLRFRPVSLLDVVFLRITGKRARGMVFQPSSAPFVGAAAGGLVALKIGLTGDPTRFGMAMVGGLGIGTVAGCLIWMLDPAPPDKRALDLGFLQDGSMQEAAARAPQSLVGRVLAVLAILLLCMPGLGLLLGLLALVMTYAGGGWPRRLAWTATGLSATYSMALIAAWAFH